MSTNTTTRAMLKGFLKLPIGWHFREGVPPTEHAVQVATDLINELEALGYNDTHPFPGIEGEIGITVYSSYGYFECTLETNGTWELAHHQRRAIPEGVTKSNTESLPYHYKEGMSSSELLDIFPTPQSNRGLMEFILNNPTTD